MNARKFQSTLLIQQIENTLLICKGLEMRKGKRNSKRKPIWAETHSRTDLKAGTLRGCNTWKASAKVINTWKRTNPY